MAMLPNRDSDIEKVFPLLIQDGYKITSPKDDSYNCIAWAATDQMLWWWPDPTNQNYWPDGVSRTATVESFLAAYNTIGYQICDSFEMENGYEKIVIFVDANNTPTHAARQISESAWTSKLGRSYDIAHGFSGLNGKDYGTPQVVMKRSIT